jgi:hypothetical protein
VTVLVCRIPYMINKLLVSLFFVVVVVTGCSTDSEPAPFFPAKIDVIVAMGDLGRNTEFVDSQYPVYVGRWLLYLLSEQDLGSREAFHDFAGQGESHRRKFDLDIAVNMINSGTLPKWAVPYFHEPHDGIQAVFACAARYDNGQITSYWHSYGVKACTDTLPALWVTDVVNGEQVSWSDFLNADPLFGEN